MPRTYRTWTPTVSRDAASILTDAQAVALASMTIREFDEEEAAIAMLAALGITLTPCCGEDRNERPCAECHAEMTADAMDRAVDMGRDEAALRDWGKR